jgi:hypothetical protein
VSARVVLRARCAHCRSDDVVALLWVDGGDLAWQAVAASCGHAVALPDPASLHLDTSNPVPATVYVRRSP